MKPYVTILQGIDQEFQMAILEFKSDPLFLRTDTLYTDDDKVRISRIWKNILKPFLRLRWIIRALSWRSFFGIGKKNTFVVQYSGVVMYYNMVHELRQTFSVHEDFLRQYLDDTFPENYSTLARYIYHMRFYSTLMYPREFFLTMRDEVHPSLYPLFDREQKVSGDIEKRFSLDSSNVHYYFKYRLVLLLSWLSRGIGMGISKIYVSRRTIGYIQREYVHTILRDMKPGDILLSRRNWALTNLGIPGFWKHMSMYVGTTAYLEEYFPEALKHRQLCGNSHYIIEAVGTGVRLVDIEELTAHNDYLGVIRTRFSPSKIQIAISKTLSQIDAPYDFGFNYYSDMNHVCSALITKAYLPAYTGDEGLHITLTRIATGITYPPHDILKKMNAEYHSADQELDVVGFIDSREKTGENFIAPPSTFLSTVSRSRLSFFLS